MKGDYSVARQLAGALDIPVPADKKGSAGDRAIRYVQESGAELFHDQHGEVFITFLNDLLRREGWPLKSKAAAEFIRWQFFQQEGKGLPGEALATARGTLAAKARFQGLMRRLSVRVAWVEDMLWYDLGDWRSVAVSVDGWGIVGGPPVLFRHYDHQTAQAEPQPAGNLDLFLDLINLTDPEARLLLKVYLVAGLLPDIPLPILLVFGEHGSAKSFLFKLLLILEQTSKPTPLA